MSNLEILNPLNYPDWDELVLSSQNYSFFHSSAWARVLHESYNYKPLYFTKINGNKFEILIPLMEINSIITGRRGVSLPFSDFCEPIITEEVKIDDVLNQIIDFGKKAGWKHLEWRFDDDYLKGVITSSIYFGHTLSLQKNEKEVFSKFRDSTKRNIKKAKKIGVECKILSSLNSMKEFYRLNCLTRKEHGIPPQPWHFFKNIFEFIISVNKGFVVLASHSNKIIAGSVYFCFGDKVYYKYGASDKEFQQLRPNNLVMWDAIEWSSQNGFRQFNFGRTEPENAGLLQFKRGWRGEEEAIYYYKYDQKRDVFVKDDSGMKSSYKIFKSLPSPLLKAIGSILYRHVG